jgi:GNAT superfamily N-acetyltransferase
MSSDGRLNCSRKLAHVLAPAHKAVVTMETRVLIPPSWVELASLISASREEGFLFLVRLEHEYLSGKVRYDGSGETLLGVFENSRLIAVGGLTQETDSDVPCTGRVRDVYVLPECRLRGIGKALLAELERRARPHFKVLVLRTSGVAIARFYERVGYSRAKANSAYSHRRVLAS